MRAGTLEKAMGLLGGTFIVVGVLQPSIDGRSVLLPFLGIALLIALIRVGRYERFRASPWFALSVGCVVLGIGLALVALLPGRGPRTPSTITLLRAFAGTTAYAGALRDWCRHQGWAPPAEKAIVARRWLGAATGLFLVGLVVVTITVQPTTVPASEMMPTTAFLGRTFRGWAAEVVMAAALLTWLVGLLKRRGASQRVRHSLRAQPDAELVAA